MLRLCGVDILRVFYAFEFGIRVLLLLSLGGWFCGLRFSFWVFRCGLGSCVLWFWLSLGLRLGCILCLCALCFVFVALCLPFIIAFFSG